MKLSLLPLGAVVLAGAVACGPKTTMSGAGVHVAKDRAEVNGCQPISGVDATNSNEDRATTDLRNKAGSMNANWVLVDDKIENGGQVALKGTAYTCVKPLPGTTPADE